jgi:ADP-dependent NAD(P)H-hydrate dehydratase / NAD(P)H-hydrate epimerase
MIKILSAPQIKQLDAYTIQNEPIASIDLMERACRAFVNWFIERYDTTHKVGIICGTGNNGGDGLGIARLLHEWNYPVTVWIVHGSVNETNDFLTNRERIKNKIAIIDIIDQPADDLAKDQSIIIDALFGSGLSRPLDGVYASVIKKLNDTVAVKLSVDIPSGLQADTPSAGEIFKAHHTITFQLPKLAFLLSENKEYAGEWHILDIGLSRQGIKEAEAIHFLLTEKDIKKMVRVRGRFDHKGKFGHALLVAGSRGKMGACVLAARAALRSGPGLLTVHIPSGSEVIIHTAVPEAMASLDSSVTHFSDKLNVENFQTVGVGPGMGQHADTVKALHNLLDNFKKPMVLDADALNIISSQPELMQLIPKGSILTPHRKEFERLVGACKNDFDRLDKLVQLSKQLQSVVVLKGAYSAIAAPDGKIYFNPTGNPGMAKGGSGDALTGILTGLLAQGYDPTQAAQTGVYVHGLAGDLAAHESGQTSLIATDLVERLPLAFKRLA